MGTGDIKVALRSPINNRNGTDRRVSYSNRTTLRAIKLSTPRRPNTNGSSSRSFAFALFGHGFRRARFVFDAAGSVANLIARAAEKSEAIRGETVGASEELATVRSVNRA